MSLAATWTHEVPRRVWKGTGLQILGRLWGAACTFAILWMAADRLESASFGRFTFYLAVFAWLDALANMGTGQVAVQRTVNAPERVGPVLRTARRVRLASGLAGVALVGGLAYAFREPGWKWILLASFYPVTHTLELSATVFKNQIAWRIPVAMRAIASALSLGGVLVLYLSRVHEPAPYLVAVAAGSTVANVLLHQMSSPYLVAARSTDAGPEPLGKFLAAALPLGLSGLCAQTYFWIDNLFVKAYIGDVALGRYNVAVRFMSWMIMVAQYASLAVLPWFTARWAAGALDDALVRLGRPLFFGSCTVAGLFWPATGAVLGWTFGPEFVEASAALRWLLLACVCVYLGSMLLTAVVAIGDTRAMLVIAASGLALNVGANFWAVPALGIEGAGMTTFLTEAFVALGALVALRRHGVVPAWNGGRWMMGPLLFATGYAVSSLALMLV